MKILVADDDLGSRLVAQSAVQALGHECITAANGDEAWQLTTQLRPDVVVTDRDMPGLDGITLCRRIRAEQQHGYTYLILLTALDHPDQVLAGMVGGADDYLTKPLKPFDLQTRLLAATRVTELHAALARARKALEAQMHTDPLTGLRNRLGLTADLEQVHNVSERYHHSYCVAMCDIDFFKAYNDTYGHPAGDQALRTVAATLTAHVRKGPNLPLRRRGIPHPAARTNHRGGGHRTEPGPYTAAHPRHRTPRSQPTGSADDQRRARRLPSRTQGPQLHARRGSRYRTV